MNKIIFYFFITIGFIFFNSCKKNENRLPLVNTSTFQVGVLSAQIAGVLYNEGDAEVTEKGICWGVLADVSISNNKVISNSKDQAFTVEVSGLDYAKTYYARAYAISSLGVSYGKVITFKTNSNDLPSMSLAMPTPANATSADIDLQINQQTKATFTTGICWSTSPMPTVLNNTVFVAERTHSNTVPFINNYQKSFQNLNESTTYYARAFSTNGVSLAYSNQLTFSTPNPVSIYYLSSLGITDAAVSSTIANINAAEITAVGVCWSQSPLPTIADAKEEQGYSGTTFFSNVNPLNPATTYFLRAYVTTTVKTIYSAPITIKTYKGTVTDIDGNIYYTVEIGNQEWMASNLKTTRYNNGITLQYVADYNQWVNSVNGQIPVYCYYADQSANNATYGKLYPRYVALNTSIAPLGWHVPTVSEWETLFLNSSLSDLWYNGSNLFGNQNRLSLSPGGRWDNGYSDLNLKGYFWAPPGAGTPNSIVVSPTSTLAMWNSNGNGYSIRCVKN